MIANGGHEGIAAEDWIDRNQLKAEAAELFDISQQAVSKALNTTESAKMVPEVVPPEWMIGWWGVMLPTSIER